MVGVFDMVQRGVSGREGREMRVNVFGGIWSDWRVQGDEKGEDAMRPAFESFDGVPVVQQVHRLTAEDGLIGACGAAPCRRSLWGSGGRGVGV